MGDLSRLRQWRGTWLALTAGAFGVFILTEGPLLLAPRLQRTPRVQEIERGTPGARMVALTFDAGGETAAFDALLASLAEANRQCTFFVTGRWATEHPQLVRKLIEQRHEVGNHTWSHRDLTLLPDEEVRSEILRADEALTRLTGKSPRPLWRAPYGARNARVLRIASQLGYTSIYWSLDSLDSVGEKKSAAFAVSRITGHPDEFLEGAIVLMHVGEPTTAQAVPQILANLRERRLRAVTVSQLLEAKTVRHWP